MKPYAALALILIVCLVTPATSHPLSGQGDEEQPPQLTAEEKREARELAATFIRRFGETRDIAPLVSELFVRDLGQRLRNETSDDSFLLLVEPETVKQASNDELNRYYVAVMNCYISVLIYRHVAKYEKNRRKREEDDEKEPTLRETFPPEVMAALKSDPKIAAMFEDAENDEGAESDTSSSEGGADKPEKDFTLRSVEHLRAATVSYEEATTKMRDGLKALPNWPLANLLGQDLPSGALTDEGEDAVRLKMTSLSDSFRGQPENSYIVCVSALMFHIDLAKVEGRFRILNVSVEDYKIQTTEEKQRAERLRSLLNAIEEGDQETFASLLQTDINAKEDDGGATPLPYAAMYGRLDMLETLIARGANVNAKNKPGNTVLIYATRSAEMTLVLLNAGADAGAIAFKKKKWTGLTGGTRASPETRAGFGRCALLHPVSPVHPVKLFILKSIETSAA